MQHVFDADVGVLRLDRTPTVRVGRDVGAAHEAEVLLLIADRHLEPGRDRAVGATAGRAGVEDAAVPQVRCEMRGGRGIKLNGLRHCCNTYVTCRPRKMSSRIC